jgi:single-strand DNA-binding protein
MNKFIGIGNLVRDPELRTTANGVSMCSFTIAAQRSFKDASGNKQTDFIPVVTWRQLADTCGKYLAQGKKVAVMGELQTRNYEAKDGTRKYVTEVVADEVEFLTPREKTEPQLPPQETLDTEGFTDIDDDELPF